VAFSDSTWRWNGDDAEHRCDDVIPQAGHSIPTYELVTPGSEQELYRRTIANTIAKAALNHAIDRMHEDRAELLKHRAEVDAQDAQRIIDGLPADVAGVLHQLQPLYEFQGGQDGWFVKGNHVDPALFVKAVYAGLVTEAGMGMYADLMHRITSMSNPEERVCHVWWRAVPRGDCGSMYLDAEPESRGAFKATVLEW